MLKGAAECAAQCSCFTNRFKHDTSICSQSSYKITIIMLSTRAHMNMNVFTIYFCTLVVAIGTYIL